MKRFLVFIWILGDSRGGMRDFKGDFSSFEEANEFLCEWGQEKELSTCGHILDSQTGVFEP